jgi:hypothetical protein
MLRSAAAIESRYISAVAAAAGRTGEDLRVGRALGFERREVLLALQHLARGLDPVVEEGGLHLRHGRAFDPVVRIAPVFGIFGVAQPLVGDAHATGEADLAVHHQQFAVGAVVDAAQVVPVQRVVELHFDAGVLHFLQQLVVDALAAGPVDQHVHRHAGARAFLERLGEAFADVARPVDVGLHVDGALRALDGGQHGGEDAVAVLEVLDAVAADQRRPEQSADLAPELGVVDRVAMHDLVLDALFGAHEIECEHGDERRGHDGDDEIPDHAAAAPFLLLGPGFAVALG